MKNEFMLEAYKEAKKAYLNKYVPVGAVIVKDGKIISRAYNKKNRKNCATFHAEILAIEKACKKIKNYRLTDCDIYVTKEPCLMCMGAVLSARMRAVYFGAFDKKYGVVDKIDNFDFNHTCVIKGGIEEEVCSKLLTNFFKELRGN